MNYRYNWIIDQRAIIESGLSIDIIDFSIMRILSDFAMSGNCKSMQSDGYIWFYFSWKIIPQQAPVLGLKSRQGVIRRINKLKSNNLLVGHKDNQVNNDSWYRMGENYDRLLRKTPVHEKVQGVHEKVHVPVHNDIHPPVHDRVHNKTTNINNTINNNNICVDSIESLPYYFETIEALNYLSDLVGTKFKIPTSKSLFERYDHYKSIKARLKEGYSIDELKQVTKFCYELWKDDKKFRKFIRPATIFSTKFKSHLESMQIEQSLEQKTPETSANIKNEYENYYKSHLIPHVIRAKRDELNKNYTIYKEVYKSLLDSEIFNLSKNESLTVPLLFDVGWGLCSPRAGAKPQRRLKKFEVFLKGLSDYDRNKGDLRKLFIKYLDKM